MRFRVIWDQMEECSYLPGQTARLPLKLPVAPLGADDFDRLLHEGERRSGRMVYRTACPACRACEPLRVPTARFEPTASQRRVARRNDGDVRVEVGEAGLSWERLALFNRHKIERGLARGDEPLSATGYRSWLVDTCTDTREVRYHVGKKLVAVSVLDFGRTSASAVYHYFDPDEAARSLGVYSVLKEIELCAALGFEWYYLGFYVRDCKSLSYKGSYWPHERRIDGEWRAIARE